MGRRAALKPDSRGLYNRRIGWVEGEKFQPKIYLGREEGPARLGNARLEAFWTLIEQRARRLGAPAYWTESTLRLAKALASGKRVKLSSGRVISEVASAEILEEVLRGPFAEVDLKEAIAALEVQAAFHRAEVEAIDEGLADVAGQLVALLSDSGKAPRLGQTTHQALELYQEWVRREFTEAGQVTLSGTVLLRRLEFIRRHMPDVDLGQFGTEEVEGVVRAIAKRPPARTKQKKGESQISKKYAQKTIGAFRRMIRWWAKSKAVQWTRPDDLEFLPVRVKLNREEVSKQSSPIRLDYYSVDELVTLWSYANSHERLFLSLALNCGFGQAEIAQLRMSEVHLFTEHPHTRQLGITSDQSDSWIMRGRNKTEGSWGEWQLWPVTVLGIQWWQKYRPPVDRPELIVKNNGGVLHQTTRGGNASQYLANLWQRLVNRVKNDKKDFRDLSFNKLRKTGSTFLTHLPAGGEAISSLYLGHGYRYTEDTNLTAYVNAPWPRVFAALRELREYLRPIWEAVAQPFDDPGIKKGGSNISIATIGLIWRLCGEGMKTGEIAQRAGVSTETVRRWIGRRGEEPKDDAGS
jgi:integrase